MKKNQENVFIEGQSDAWFDRNFKNGIKALPEEHRIIRLVKSLDLPSSGNLIDVGGAAGSVAAGIIKVCPGWKATVLEPSQKAVKAGSKIFPWIDFIQGSIAKKNDMPNKAFDIALVSGVLCVIDRSLLSQAIANIDSLIKPNGHIIIYDFYTPFPRANDYHHQDGIFTYKQDYSLPFKSLNIYTEIYRNSGPVKHSNFDNVDPYDVWTLISVLQKDLMGRYRRNSIK